MAALRDSLTVRERGFIVVERYAEELLRVAEGLPERAVLERWDEWIGCRFEPDTGDLRPDVATIADLDPAEIEAAELESLHLEAPGRDGDASA